MSASAAASRRGDSSSTSVASISESARRKRSRAACRGGGKPAKWKRLAGQAREHQRGEWRRGAGQHGYRDAARVRFADQTETRIRDQRGSRVADQRDDLSGLDARDQGRSRLGGVVVVIRGQATRDAVRGQQLARHARVLAGYEVGGAKRIERTQRDIAQIADRRPKPDRARAATDGSDIASRLPPSHDGKAYRACRHGATIGRKAKRSRARRGERPAPRRDAAVPPLSPEFRVRPPR